MPSKQHTTVVLNKTVQKIKDELAPIFGLKNILSAGLLLFSKLSDTEQKQAVTEAAGVEKSKTLDKPKTLREVMQNIVRATKENRQIPSTIIEISPSDEKMWAELQSIVDADSVKQQKKTKRGKRIG